jgi:hypothetical protein
MRAVAAASALGVALTLAGCGGGGSTDVLSKTADNLSKIQSGRLSMRLLVTPKSGSPFGFTLKGPFALGKQGSLPVLHVDYTQIANGRSATVTVISTGTTAYVESNGQTTQLTSDQADALRQAGGTISGKGGVQSFGVDRWFEDAKTKDGGRVGGAETDEVDAKLDVVAATNDVLALLRRTGRAIPTISGDQADRLDDAVRSSSIKVFSGKDDRLLRKLSLDVVFGFDVPKALRDALGNVVGARVQFDLAVAEPNRPVHVSAP